MRRIMFIGAAAAAVITVACSDSATAVKTPTANQWSTAVIEVAAANPNAHGEIRGVVLDSGSKLDPSNTKPIPGSTVMLNLKVTVAATGNDTAYTTVTKIGQVVTDANGRFLVMSIPEGDYYIAATSPDAMHYDNATWAFASTGAAEHDAVIYLPTKLLSPPVDSLPYGPDDPPQHPIDPPVDSVPAPLPPPPPPTTPPVDSL